MIKNVGMYRVFTVFKNSLLTYAVLGLWRVSSRGRFRNAVTF